MSFDYDTSRGSGAGSASGADAYASPPRGHNRGVVYDALSTIVKGIAVGCFAALALAFCSEAPFPVAAAALLSPFPVVTILAVGVLSLPARHVYYNAGRYGRGIVSFSGEFLDAYARAQAGRVASSHGRGGSDYLGGGYYPASGSGGGGGTGYSVRGPAGTGGFTGSGRSGGTGSSASSGWKPEGSASGTGRRGPAGTGALT